MFIFRHKGDFHNTERFLKSIQKGDIYKSLDQIAQKGVEALSAATPVDSGRTAESWGYEIDKGKSYVKISWTNDNINEGEQIAVLIQYGHGTGNGGYVQGTDYINPAMRDVFQQIADEVWREVVNA